MELHYISARILIYMFARLGTSFCSVTMGGTKCTRESKNQQIELRDSF